jgi:hypothetical protein
VPKVTALACPEPAPRYTPGYYSQARLEELLAFAYARWTAAVTEHGGAAITSILLRSAAQAPDGLRLVDPS